MKLNTSLLTSSTTAADPSKSTMDNITNTFSTNTTTLLTTNININNKNDTSMQYYANIWRNNMILNKFQWKPLRAIVFLNNTTTNHISDSNMDINTNNDINTYANTINNIMTHVWNNPNE